VARHFAVAGADFDPAMLIISRERHSGVWGDANGARNLFAPVEVRKKMLAKSLAGHARSSVSGEATCETARRR
jgi:hypothetical protein